MLSSSYIFSVQDSSRGGFVWSCGYNIRHLEIARSKLLEFVRHPAFLIEQKLSRERDVTELTKYIVSKTANFSEHFGKGGLPLIFQSALKCSTTPVQIFSCGSMTIETGIKTLL